MMIGSVALVGAVTYLATVDTVYYTVTQPATSVKPFTATQSAVNLVQKESTTYIQVTIHNTDTQAHILNCTVTGVPTGDTVTVCVDPQGTLYVPMSLPATAITTLYLKVDAGSTTGAKNFTLTLTPT
jgi:hypothetical protein